MYTALKATIAAVARADVAFMNVHTWGESPSASCGPSRTGSTGTCRIGRVVMALPPSVPRLLDRMRGLAGCAPKTISTFSAISVHAARVSAVPVSMERYLDGYVPPAKRQCVQEEEVDALMGEIYPDKGTNEK